MQEAQVMRTSDSAAMPARSAVPARERIGRWKHRGTYKMRRDAFAFSSSFETLTSRLSAPAGEEGGREDHALVMMPDLLHASAQSWEFPHCDLQPNTAL